MHSVLTSFSIFICMVSSVLSDQRRLDGKVTYSITVYPIMKSRYSRSSKRYTSKLYLDQTLRDAVQVWSTVLPNKFVEGFGNTSIKVKFYSRSHGDEYPFDGSGGEIAHSFYPSQSQKGDIHLDADEPWGPGGRNLYWVLAHEIGHCLGLPHLPPPSLMSAEYQGFLEPQPTLHPNDIRAIQELYSI